MVYTLVMQNKQNVQTERTPMTEAQIRATVKRMEQETPEPYRRPKTKLLKLALSGNPGAGFVVYGNWVRYGKPA
jgi:hypothetical protein